jgi:hypothetical protein
VAVLVVAKTGLDLVFHLREHARWQGVARSAPVPGAG